MDIWINFYKGTWFQGLCSRSQLKNCCSSVKINPKAFFKSTLELRADYSLKFFMLSLKFIDVAKDKATHWTTNLGQKSNFLLKASFESLTTFLACITFKLSKWQTSGELHAVCLFLFLCAKIHLQNLFFAHRPLPL